MIWLTLLLVIAVITAIIALLDINPSGARPVARTHLMGIARLVFLLGVAVLVYLAYRARSGT